MPFLSDKALVITMVTGHDLICGNALPKELNKCKLSDSYAAVILKELSNVWIVAKITASLQILYDNQFNIFIFLDDDIITAILDSNSLHLLLYFQKCSHKSMCMVH